MKDSYCSHCGATFGSQVHPKHCGNCNNITWRNPIPVSVVLVPIDNGLLIGRRGINPGKGELALPGGYIEYGESWRNAGARELMEEIGLEINPLDLQLFNVFSSVEHILIFSVAPIQSRKVIEEFVPNTETTEVLVATEAMPLAFESHTSMMKRFFEKIA
jgi:ADP-ribose pyrophosphatase YjhB (NUDIX family)